MAGVIEAMGPEVRDRLPGQRILAVISSGGGGYAEMSAVHSSSTVPVPDWLSFDDAASIPLIFLPAWYGLALVARLGSSETLLIQSGGSGVGSAAIQVAKYLGARVITTASTDEKVDRARTLGADEAINHVRQDFLPEVMGLTAHAGVDVVLESVGGQVLLKSIDAMAPLGRLVAVGNSGRGTERPGMDALARKNASFTSFSLGRQMGYGGVMDQLGKLLDLFIKRKLRAIVDRVFPLCDVAGAHRYVAQRRNFGKVLLRP